MTPAAMKSSDLYSNSALLPDTVSRVSSVLLSDRAISSKANISALPIPRRRAAGWTNSFATCRPVLLIGRHLQIELHCADNAISTTCYHDSTCGGAHLWQGFVDPERASLIDGEGSKEANPGARMYDGVQDLGQHAYFGIDGSRSRGVRTPLLNSDFCWCIHYHFLVIVGHSVTHTFYGGRRGCSDYCPKLFQFALYFFWSDCNVGINVFWF